MSKRSQFKFDNGQASSVVLDLVLPGRAPFHGRALAVNSEGAKARFDSTSCPGLALNMKVGLCFSSKLWKDAVMAKACVHFRHDEQSLRDYGFWFVNRAEVEETLLPRLRAMFNRRGATRAEPDPKDPVLVTLETAQRARCVNGMLLDISGTGMSIRIALEDEEAFVSAYEARATFLLQGKMQSRHSVAVRICERRLYNSHVQLGLEFDAMGTSSFVTQQQAILDYVLSRQPRSIHKRKAG